MDEQQLSPEILEQIRANALHNPHQIFIVDQVLKLAVGAGVSSVTLGNTLPNGQVVAVVTVTASTEQLYELSNQLVRAITGLADEIKAKEDAFIGKLRSQKS